MKVSFPQHYPPFLQFSTQYGSNVLMLFYSIDIIDYLPNDSTPWPTNGAKVYLAARSGALFRRNFELFSTDLRENAGN